MAITSWPRLSLLESPSGAAGSVTASSTRMRARSVSGSSPTSRARKSWPSAVVTAMRGAGAGRAGDVAVGQNKAIRRHNDARAGAAARPPWPPRRVPGDGRRTRQGRRRRGRHGRPRRSRRANRRRAALGPRPERGWRGGLGGGIPAKARRQGYDCHGNLPCFGHGIAGRECPPHAGAHIWGASSGRERAANPLRSTRAGGCAIDACGCL